MLPRGPSVDQALQRLRKLRRGAPEYLWQTAGFLIFQKRDFMGSTRRPEVLSFTRSVSLFTKALPQGLSLPSGSSSASTCSHSHHCISDLAASLRHMQKRRQMQTSAAPPAAVLTEESCHQESVLVQHADTACDAEN